MHYDFKETVLGKDFCQDRIAQIEEIINNCTPFTVVGIPGTGISLFLRYMATTDIANFIHVNIYDLPEFTKLELYKLMLQELGGNSNRKSEQQLISEIKTKLTEFSKEKEKTVIIFNRFDKLKPIIDEGFVQFLHSLREIDKGKILFIFSSSRALAEEVPVFAQGSHISTFFKSYYLKPYEKKDLERLVAFVDNPYLNTKDLHFKKALELSGGHSQLFNLLLKTERSEEPLKNPFVKAQLKEIYDLCNYSQKKQLLQIALGKTVSEVDSYLTNIGIVREDNDIFTFFTPLLAEFIKNSAPVKLPAKEAILFRVLKKTPGIVVSKDELFKSVWPTSPEEASDWALNSLIYRLRKNPSFIRSGYVIESYKKLGYRLVK